MKYKNQPEISCVIPAYENVDFISRAIMSILTQLDVEIDIVVCDDSTSKDVKEIVLFLVERYPQLRYLDGARSGNPVDNWNYGINASSTKYCVLIHHDEFFLDKFFLRKAIDLLESHEGAVVIGGVAVIGIERNSRFSITRRVRDKLNMPLWTLFIKNWIGPTASVVFKRYTSESSRLIFNPKLIYLVDVDFYFRLFRHTPNIIYLKGISVGSVGHHTSQISAQCDKLKHSFSEIQEISKHTGINIIQYKILFLILYLRKVLERFL